MKEPYRIGVVGIGTVGIGVIRILQTHSKLLSSRANRALEIKAVCSRDQSKDRGINLTDYKWYDDPLEMVDDPEIDAIVELVGGSDGPILDLAHKTLENGKAFVTANKALLAHHGYELSRLAEQNKTSVMYEAAVAGGIPIIKTIREGFAGNEINAVYGILNGTCNYILSEMQNSGRDFDDVLKDAQDKGYAEADPSFDVDGVDTAHKLCLLTALSFGTKPDFDSLVTSGIRKITIDDINFASELGYKIKLLGVAKRLNGKIVQSVAPCLVPKESTIAAVDGSFNAVYVEGDFVDTGMSVGRGAGEGPTASAVIADIIDLARGYKVPVFGVSTEDLSAADYADVGDIVSGFYIHLVVTDQPGVLADITAILRDHNVSMEAVSQRGRDPDKPVSFVMISHEARQADIQLATDKIEAMDTVLEKPRVIRIETI